MSTATRALTRCARPGCREQARPGRSHCSTACSRGALFRRQRDPTPAQLRARCAAVRAGWTEATERRRRAVRAAELLVSRGRYQ